jgi:hypothetical protein
VGKFESDVEALLLFNLVIRDIEAILTLARTDLVLLPSANVLARAVFEIALKAAWIVQPDDPFDREVRWLAHLAEEERLHKALSESVASPAAIPMCSSNGMLRFGTSEQASLGLCWLAISNCGEILV